MELEAYIQAHIEHERKRLGSNPSLKEKAQTWISTIEKAPRSIDAVQAQIDAKEVALNKVTEISELQQLDRELAALEWLRSMMMRNSSNEKLAIDQ
jgi:hypothetical protein